MGRLRVMVTGLDDFARIMANGLNSAGQLADNRPLRLNWQGLRSFLACDVVYFVGGITRPRRLVWLMSLLKPIVFHWVGTDVLKAVELVRKDRLEALYPFATHWAETDWLAEELIEAGISAKVMPLSPVQLPVRQIPSLPKEFLVLTYLPHYRGEFYGRPVVKRLAQSFPHVRFQVVGSDGQDWDEHPPNVQFLGWVKEAEMEGIYAQATVLIRYPKHDGMSFMVMEALGRGRHVLWTHSLPGVRLVGSYEEIAAHLRELRAAHDAQQLDLNESGITFVRAHLAPDKVLGDIRAGLQRAADRNGSSAF